MSLKHFVLLCACCVYATDSFDSDPKVSIAGDFERIIDANADLKLECTGSKPLEWSYPQKEKTGSYSHVKVFPSKSGTQYISKLTLFNASYTDIGFYKCYEMWNDEESAQTYLYVNDENHLSDLTDFRTITGYYNEEVILPCRPTHPSIDVRLYNTNEDALVHLGIKDQNGFEVNYNPTIGFVFNSNHGHLHVHQEAIYKCTFRKGNVEEERHVHVVFAIRKSDIARPDIKDLSNGHTVVGDVLPLMCSIRALPPIGLNWLLPNNEIITDCTSNGRFIAMFKEGNPHDYHECLLNITNVTLKDKGRYSCLVEDQHKNRNNITKDINVYQQNEHNIKLTQENDLFVISVTAGENVIWTADIDAHPVPQVTWYDNRNQEIVKSSPKFNITNNEKAATIQISHVSINERGNFTLKATNVESKNLTFFLNVTDKPTVEIESDDYYIVNKNATLKCNVAAYPKPQIFWTIQLCPNGTCAPKNFPLKESYRKSNGLVITSYLQLKATKRARVTCTAINSLGQDDSTKDFRISDVKNGFDVWGYDLDESGTIKSTTVAVGDQIKIYCGVDAAAYTNDVYWYKMPNFLPIGGNNDQVDVEKSSTMYSYRTTLTIKQLSFNDSGEYICRANRISTNLQDFVSKSLRINVKKPSKPKLLRTSMVNKTVQITFPQKAEMFCYFDGVPMPEVTWYKNDKVFNPEDRRIQRLDRNQRIIFNETDENDEGTYACSAQNKIGEERKEIFLKLKNKKETMNYILVLVVGLLTLLLLIFAVTLTIKIMKERKLKRELKMIGLDNFEQGLPDSINPDLRIDDQAELLPYEKKWEFPRDRLKLGKQLGSGAFGVVLKAQAYGISDEEDSTTVAVKMVKKNADYMYIKALADELKIMIHLGKHLNVVNLLGACTGKVAKRELLVIVEFCKYGNLHNYLLRHRDNFINQVDPVSNTIDYTIGAEILNRSFSVSTTRSNSNSNPAAGNEMVDYRGNVSYTGATANTETTTICMTPTGEDGVTLSNNSVQPEWRYNYRGDYKGNVKPISTKDLITYAFQVSRGMEYLASRKVLHGDLAARNILLAENGVVKICDFGLAKSIYKSDNYKKKGDGPLPVKWMAIESIRDRTFSTQSDVWSFGIVLWEFFSLARSPYPGMEADEKLYHKLVEGYRMDSPTYATSELYNMMLDCWNAKPTVRPSFTRLAEKLGSMLEESVRQHYVDLNDPYLVMNTQRLEEVKTDYLDMVRQPDCEEASSPHFYVNDMTILNNKNAEGYTVMSPLHLNALKNADGVFNFETHPELRPMLSESEPASPVGLSEVTANSVANPSYGLPPSVVKSMDDTEREIVKCSDNYVNMPESKNVLKNERNCEKIVENDKPYVNNEIADWRIKV